MERNDIIRQTVASLTQGHDPLKARIILFEKVRDIGYVYPASRDPIEALQGSRGSCSAKHKLLADMFRCLGLKVRHMICTHRFNESPIAFPESMQDLLRKNEIVDFHDYLQLSIDGDWIDVDAAWEDALREYGFPVNEDWDGRSPMLVSVAADDSQIADGDPEKLRDEMLSHMTPRQRSLRKQFLEALSAWVQEITVETRRDSGSG